MQKYDMDKILVCDIIDIYNGRFSNYDEYRDSHEYYYNEINEKHYINLQPMLLINPELFNYIRLLNTQTNNKNAL